MNLELRYTLSDQEESVVKIEDQRMLIGTLLSNEVVLQAPGIDPIHALIERTDDGTYVIVDLGSQGGVVVNGKKIDVESRLVEGDVIGIGPIDLSLRSATVLPGSMFSMPEAAAIGLPHPPVDSRHFSSQVSHAPVSAVTATTSRTASEGDGEKRGSEAQLFSPREARPRGDILEVVSYWGNTILDVELFSPAMAGFESCYIGDLRNSHMLAGGKADVEKHRFAIPNADGYELSLLDGMKARIRKSGEVIEKSGPKTIRLGLKDIAHITYDAVHYFVLYVKPPPLDLPPNRARDPFFAGLLGLAMLLYMVSVGTIWQSETILANKKDSDVWQLVSLPEKKELDKPKPKQKVEPPKPETKVEPKPPPKPEQKIVEKEVPPPPNPPVPPPKAPVAAKSTTKPVEKPVEPKPVENPAPNAGVKAPLANVEVPKKPDLSKLASSSKSGMADTGALKPDFKLAGPPTPNPAKSGGGAKGSGMNQPGAAIKGNQAHSVKGVEGVQNNKPSGVNLSKLGQGLGKIHSQTGPGAISTNFQSAAGGMGGGSGSGAKTLGFGGGVGSGRSLGIAGSAGAINNFGNGAGGPGGGLGGSGGLGGAGLGDGFGRGPGGAGSGRANVVVPPGDPVVSGGLTSAEVQAVIRANLNQIRHCYEQLLQRSPSAAGKIKVQFVVDPNGRVSSSSIVSSSISDANMNGCVSGKVSRWSFPKPRGGSPVTVSYPFVFNPL